MTSLDISQKLITSDRNKLLTWYIANHRELPWRTSKEPYKIWISEVMLQQTTVAAVIPYYTKFIERFPTVQSLANSTIEDVYEYWAGLGYYSRARNLHKSAVIIAELIKNKKGFPQSYQQLIELPGFGPYTSRAVSSLAFNEKVGVLDGNVIRVLSRKYGLDLNWWETESRTALQSISDQLASSEEVSNVNQALMELGATLCTPKKVLCLMCPWTASCHSRKDNKKHDRPLKKPKADFEKWEWVFDIQTQKKKNKTFIFLSENQSTPFLKKNWLPPSTAKKIKATPKTFDFKHGVTKFDIYVKIQLRKLRESQTANGKWVPIDSISQINPTSLIKKIIAQL